MATDLHNGEDELLMAELEMEVVGPSVNEGTYYGVTLPSAPPSTRVRDHTPVGRL
jgi:hypothetical protein